MKTSVFLIVILKYLKAIGIFLIRNTAVIIMACTALMYFYTVLQYVKQCV